ncbi:MAG: CDP-alcohol phosphatidyltransferase family protein, partial [Clostridia bacterium]|nr:CDP-alcohol phosphatidyltransferase family protein [Clostridia bacterium]
MNLPNKLTVLRLFLVPVIVAVMLIPMPTIASNLLAAAIFGATALTDMLDGKIARKYNLITDFGKFLDPLADKFMV